MRWTKEIGERPSVKRGRMVNRTSGRLEEQLHERHDASDFETRTQDKVGARGFISSTAGTKDVTEPDTLDERNRRTTGR